MRTTYSILLLLIFITSVISCEDKKPPREFSSNLIILENNYDEEILVRDLLELSLIYKLEGDCIHDELFKQNIIINRVGLEEKFTIEPDISKKGFGLGRGKLTAIDPLNNAINTFFDNYKFPKFDSKVIVNDSLIINHLSGISETILVYSPTLNSQRFEVEEKSYPILKNIGDLRSKISSILCTDSLAQIYILYYPVNNSYGANEKSDILIEDSDLDFGDNTESAIVKIEVEKEESDNNMQPERHGKRKDKTRMSNPKKPILSSNEERGIESAEKKQGNKPYDFSKTPLKDVKENTIPIDKTKSKN